MGYIFIYVTVPLGWWVSLGPDHRRWLEVGRHEKGSLKCLLITYLYMIIGDGRDGRKDQADEM